MQFTTVLSSIAIASSLLVAPAAGQSASDSSVISSTVAAASAGTTASGTPCTDSEATNSTASGCVPAKSPVLASGIVVAAAADANDAKSSASGSLQLLSAGKPLSMMGLVAAGFALYA